MADTIMALPNASKNDGSVVPIKAVDLGDGTYAIAANTGTASGTNVAFPGTGSGAQISMATVALDGGVFALKTN